MSKLKPTNRKSPTAKSTKPGIQRLLLSRINREKTQTRAKINEETVAEYAELMKGRRNPFPPLVVYQDKNGVYLLSDGFHRFLAALKQKLRSIACEVRQGTVRDALKYAFTANDKHGLRRTNADKRKAVTIALGDEKWGESSDRAIAKVCGVSNNFVGKVRKETRKRKVSSISKRTGADNKKYPATKASRGNASSSDKAGARALDLLKQLGQILKTLRLHSKHSKLLAQVTADVKAKGKAG